MASLLESEAPRLASKEGSMLTLARGHTGSALWLIVILGLMLARDYLVSPPRAEGAAPTTLR